MTDNGFKQIISFLNKKKDLKNIKIVLKDFRSVRKKIFETMFSKDFDLNKNKSYLIEYQKYKLYF